jgi:hypothetical protein
VLDGHNVQVQDCNAAAGGIGDGVCAVSLLQEVVNTLKDDVETLNCLLKTPGFD